MRIGQSAMASEPSFIPSVSRYGEATEPRVEMVPADDDRRADLPFFDEMVDDRAEARALAVAQPADARGKALELDPVPRLADPAGEGLISGNSLRTASSVT